MDVAEGDGAWPAIGHEDRVWTNHVRPPNRADRLFREYHSAIPPHIAERSTHLSPAVAGAVAEATAAIAVLDAKPTFDMTALGGLLLRSESVASSKIERLDVSQRDLARALIGAARPKSIASRVAANVRALQRAVALAADADITRQIFTEIHRVLMQPDEDNAREAGVTRSEQNWSGGSDYTPRDAMFVPPKPELVPALLDDLAAFVGRSDMAAVVQAAVAHAQFETVHPFIDGNGRTGRALVHLVFQRRSLVTQTVVPVSTVLLADPDSYFDGLELYRRGALDEWVQMFAAAAALAATSGAQLGGQLRDIADDWNTTAHPRAGSAVKKLLDGLVRQPVVDIDQVAKLCPGVASTNLHRAVNRLVEAGILAPITTGKRNQVWAATDVIDLLERFEKDVIGRRKPSSTAR
jgi:Fic family protein